MLQLLLSSILMNNFCIFCVITLYFHSRIHIFAEQKRKEAIASSNELTQALVDHLNVG